MKSSSAELKNRRSDVRWMPRGGITVTCQHGNTGLGPNLAVTILDISETGIRLVANAALEKHDEIEINMLASGNPAPVRLLADVVWSVATADGNYCLGATFQKRMPYSDLIRLTQPGA